MDHGSGKRPFWEKEAYFRILRIIKAQNWWGLWRSPKNKPVEKREKNKKNHFYFGGSNSWFLRSELLWNNDGLHNPCFLQGPITNHWLSVEAHNSTEIVWKKPRQTHSFVRPFIGGLPVCHNHMNQPKRLEFPPCITKGSLLPVNL